MPKGPQGQKIAYYAGMIWVGAVLLEIAIFGADEALGIWPGFFGHWYADLLLFLATAVPGAILWWWGRTQMKRRTQNA